MYDSGSLTSNVTAVLLLVFVAHVMLPLTPPRQEYTILLLFQAEPTTNCQLPI